VAAKVAGEIQNNDDVKQEDTQTDGCESVNEFVDFKRDENGRDDDDKVFRPTFPQDQADAFDEPESGIDKAAEAEFADLFGRDGKDAGEELVEVLVVRVHPEEVDPVEDGGGDIAVQVTEEPQTQGEEREGFDEFPGADENEGDGGGGLRVRPCAGWLGAGWLRQTSIIYPAGFRIGVYVS
jgi:hypothetical protein